MNDQLKTFLSGLLTTLVDLRKFGHDGGRRVSYAVGQITAAERLGVLTYDQAERFRDLLLSASKHAFSPFPCDENSGPCMPIDVWWSRHKTALDAKHRLLKLQAQDSANEESEPVPAPTAPRQLRLLCVLDILSAVSRPRYIPAGTMHRLSPRASCKGRWALEGDAFYQMRETHPKRPTAQVLARCVRQRQTNAFRSAARTI